MIVGAEVNVFIIILCLVVVLVMPVKRVFVGQIRQNGLPVLKIQIAGMFLILVPEIMKVIFVALNIRVQQPNIV